MVFILCVCAGPWTVTGPGQKGNGYLCLGTALCVPFLVEVCQYISFLVVFIYYSLNQKLALLYWLKKLYRGNDH